MSPPPIEILVFSSSGCIGTPSFAPCAGAAAVSSRRPVRLAAHRHRHLRARPSSDAGRVQADDAAVCRSTSIRSLNCARHQRFLSQRTPVSPPFLHSTRPIAPSRALCRFRRSQPGVRRRSPTLGTDRDRRAPMEHERVAHPAPRPDDTLLGLGLDAAEVRSALRLRGPSRPQRHDARTSGPTHDPRPGRRQTAGACSRSTMSSPSLAEQIAALVERTELGARRLPDPRRRVVTFRRAADRAAPGHEQQPRSRC